jgi:hypothetical protein
MIYVRRIWRALQPNLDVWACEPCQQIVRLPSIEGAESAAPE